MQRIIIYERKRVVTFQFFWTTKTKKKCLFKYVDCAGLPLEQIIGLNVAYFLG